MNVEVNQKAPAYSESQILIHAPIENVYQLLSTINAWPNWQSQVTDASIKGEIKEGATFHWKAGGFRIHSKIHTAETPEKLGWTGNMLWIKAIHNWSLSPEGKSTRVKVQESMEGFLARFMQKTLTDGMQKNLYELKLEAEKNG